MKTEQLAAMTSEELQIHADSLAAKMSAEFLLYATLRSRGHSKAYSAEHYKKLSLIHI